MNIGIANYILIYLIDILLIVNIAIKLIYIYFESKTVSIKLCQTKKILF